MATPENITYLVRHGSYDYSSGGLDDAGREESARARDLLFQSGLGGKALVLCSDAYRALQTAHIIAAGLDTTAVPSKRIRLGATDYTSGVENLDEWLDRALADAGQTLDDDQALVVVTHAPMIAIAKGLYAVDPSVAVEFAEVYPYIHGSWHNPGFKSVYETIAENRIAS